MEIITTEIEKKKDEELEKALEDIHANMTRKERREWYRRNKRKLNLPSWGELQNIKAI